MPVIYSCPSFKFFAGIALLCAVPAIAACDRQSEAPSQPEAGAGPSGEDAKAGAGEFSGVLDETTRGEEMPDISLTLPDGTTKKLADFKGKPLLVNLWATWCGPCKLEMPMLDALAAKQEGKLKVLTVSQDLDGAEKVTPWWDAQKFDNLEPWLEPANDLGFHYGTGMLPTTVLYDAEGKEVWRMIGGYDWSGAEADALLARTLADPS